METAEAEQLADFEESFADGVSTDSGKLARKKWGHSVDSGFQIVPNVLFRCQKILGLDALDTVILLNITTHWWEPGDLPHPRPSVIAKRVGVQTRTVERRLKELQENGFLVRLDSTTKNGRSIRPFDLSGLVQKLKAVSTENLKRRAISAHSTRSAQNDDAP
jgi:predicted transcriptional regulator